VVGALESEGIANLDRSLLGTMEWLDGENGGIGENWTA
jgi:hypothetical protein